MGLKFWLASRLPYMSRCLAPVLGRDKVNFVLAHVAEDLVPHASQTMPSGHEMTFFCPSELLLWRVETLFTKEPETIEWMDTFAPGDVFWDIGANIGLYSMYAASERDCEVLAFEPTSMNYFIINKNINLNMLDDKIKVFAVAFGDNTQLGSLNLSSISYGTALHTFGKAEDWRGESYTPHMQQGAPCFTIDEFIEVFDASFPNHIKVDVDGLEPQIVVGAAKTLQDSRLKSVLLELDSAQEESTIGIVEQLARSGLVLKERRHSDMIESSSFGSVYNYIFVRES